MSLDSASRTLLVLVGLRLTWDFKRTGLWFRLVSIVGTGVVQV